MIDKIKKIFHKHKHSKWFFKTPIEIYRTCESCGDVEEHNGLIEKYILTGDPSPYIFKN